MLAPSSEGNVERAASAALRYDGPLTSVSQINLFRECQRKWAFRYLLGIKTPQHPAAALGTDIDDNQLQPLIRDGRPLDFTRESGEIAAAGLAFLPQPKTPGVEVQKHFVMPSPTWRDGQHIGFGFQGFIDLYAPDSALIPGMPGGAPFVGDFKSTSNLKWAKTETELKTDTQANLYGFATMWLTKAREVDLAWMYFQTKGPRRAIRRYLRVTADHVCEQFGKINETAIDMLGVRIANPHPLDLPPSPEACGAFGGCPHQATCALSPAQVIEALDAKALNDALHASASRGEMTMSNVGNDTDWLAKLKAKKSGAQGGSAISVTPAAPSASAPPTSSPAPEPQPTLEEHIKANPRAAFLLKSPDGDPRYDVVGTKADGSNLFRYEAEGLPAPINPPESVTEPQAAAANTIIVPEPAPAPAAAAAAPAKKGPGRPKKIGAPAAEGEAPRTEPLTTTINIDASELVKIARAVRAAADTFLAGMGVS